MQRLLSIVVLLVWQAIPAQAETPDALRLAKRIDHHLQTRWKQEGVQPAPRADDETFVRRIYLDLVGRIPTVVEVREFLRDDQATKRTELIERLLASGEHHRHAATFWRRTWIPQLDTPQFDGLAEGCDAWLSARIAEDASYADLARELITARPDGRAALGQTAGSQAFVGAAEALPERLAAHTARAFLGLNLDCAQCHDHPFARWTRDQFWQTAAFFSEPVTKPNDAPPRLELKIPETKTTVPAQLLSSDTPPQPDALAKTSGPEYLAGWITSPDNPYFAKNAVNRLWAQLFGTGLVEPLDDLSPENPSRHPELLNDLAAAFAGSGFDLQFLTKALVLSEAYQLSSKGGSGNAASDPQWFAQMPVRGLTGEQLYESLRVAAGLPVFRPDLDSAETRERRKEFLARFLTERPAHTERSIAQALTLFNGQMTLRLTDPAASPTLLAVGNAPFLDTRGQVETLCLAALARKPSEKEFQLFVPHIDNSQEPRQALADVFWILLNCSEFHTNH